MAEKYYVTEILSLWMLKSRIPGAMAYDRFQSFSDAYRYGFSKDGSRPLAGQVMMFRITENSHNSTSEIIRVADVEKGFVGHVSKGCKACLEKLAKNAAEQAA